MSTPFGDGEGLSRRDHQATAKAAALDVMPRSGTQRRRIFEYIWMQGSTGATRDEVAGDLDMSPNTVRPRIKELIDGGWVEASGQTRPTPMRRAAEVLVLTAEAHSKLGQLL